MRRRNYEVTLIPMDSVIELSEDLVKKVKPLKIMRKRIPVLFAVVYMPDIDRYGFHKVSNDEVFCNMATYDPVKKTWGFFVGGLHAQVNVPGILMHHGVKSLDPITVPVYVRRVDRKKVYVIDIRP